MLDKTSKQILEYLYNCSDYTFHANHDIRNNLHRLIFLQLLTSWKKMAMFLPPEVVIVP